MSVSTLPKLTYPPCPNCDGYLTVNTNQVSNPTAWQQDMVFSIGVVCECGYTSSIPPDVIRRDWQNCLFFVRVPATLQNTDAGRNRACFKIPFKWRHATWGFRWIEERRYGDYRWWLFEALKLRPEKDWQEG